ncbi:hypothetical protein [Mycoplasma yeatsii]|uniref:hypothetical protein n=1 Tax=Mycoplasma yeatsii TaxID=51365 RepID=UPI0005B24CB7|nr:hypothetical protein [Mycoplasma yeatsii]AJM71888.1 membrane protein [Mycoplasma yeatsii GM274B]
MKKIFNLFLLIFISLASLFSSSFNITKNTFNSNYHITQNTDLNKNDFDENKHVTWGGHALRYFLYKNSSASYNEEHRQRYDKLVKALIRIGLKDAPRPIDNLKEKNEEFKYAFLSSAIVVSKYGSTEPEEFFAESFSRYISSNESQKNTTYYLLEHFFNNTFQKLKRENLGGILDKKKWKKIEEKINEDFEERRKKDNFFGYDIFLKNTNLSSQDLGYEKDKDFGFFSPKYITSTLEYTTLDIYKTYTEELFLSKRHIPFFDVKPWKAVIEISENELSKIEFNENGTLETILEIRSMLKSFANAQLYNPFKGKKNNKEEATTYKSFGELNNHWKKNSLFNFKLHSAINLEKTINNLDNKTFLDQKEWFSKNDLKETLVKLFNKVEQITKNRFKDIFINLIITNHKTIDLGKRSSQGVNGVTLTRINEQKQGKNSPIFSYVVIRTKSFSEKDTKDSFLDSWFSSNHVFQTVNHEFGHILDYFLAQTEEQAEANKKSFNEAFWARHQPRNLYSSDKSQSKIINLKIVLFISLIIVSSSSIVALIFIFHKRKKH